MSSQTRQVVTTNICSDKFFPAGEASGCPSEQNKAEMQRPDPACGSLAGQESAAQTWNTSTVCFRQATRVKFNVRLQRWDFIPLTEVKPIIARLIRMLLVAVRPGAAVVSPPRPARPVTTVLLTIAGRSPRLPPRVGRLYRCTECRYT